MELTNSDPALKSLEKALGDLTKVNRATLHEAVLAQIMWRRQKSGNAKTRSEVHGTTKKSVKQKGTGGARHGARTAPIFVGGGVCHPPKPILAAHKMNEKTFKKAFWDSIRTRFADKKVWLLAGDDKCKGKTKEVAVLLKKSKINSALVCVAKNSPVLRASRNIHKVKSVASEGINPYDVLQHDSLILSAGTLEVLQKRASSLPVGEPKMQPKRKASAK